MAHSPMIPTFVPGASVVLFGPGYVGEAVCDLIAPVPCDILRITRSALQAQQLRDNGLSAMSFDDRRQVSAALASCTHILSTVAPSLEGEDAILDAYAGDIGSAANLSWIGYLSTTSVYGDAKGGVVTERSPTVPFSPSGVARLRAETEWRALAHAGRLDILRLSGIYGPGRSSINYIRESGMLDRSGDVNIINRIHVHDIASTIAAAARRKVAGGDKFEKCDVFNVSDDLPSTSRAFFQWGKELLEAYGYTVETSEAKKGPEKSTRRMYRGSKRVDNSKMKSVLGINLKYPTYRDGLARIAQLEL